jgi:hypothetical protein
MIVFNITLPKPLRAAGSTGPPLSRHLTRSVRALSVARMFLTR